MAAACTCSAACTIHESGPASVAEVPRTAPIVDYRSLTAAVEQGDVVRAVIHYGRCTLEADGKKSPGPDAVGGMDLATFESFAPMLFHNPNGFLAASEARLISHARYGYVYDYVKLRVYDDSRVEIVAQYLDPKTFDVKMDELFTCHLGVAGGVELTTRSVPSSPRAPRTQCTTTG